MSLKIASQLRTSNRVNAVEDILPQIKDRLRKAGFKSINDLVKRGAPTVSEVTGLDTKTCEDICKNAGVLLANQRILQTPIKTAADIQMSREKLGAVSTGSKNLDRLLGGRGIETDAVTQFFGQSTAGKTQLCHCLCMMVQQDPTHGGLNGKACYIDTEGKFRSERIIEIAKARGHDPKDILEGIIVEQPQNVSEQELILEKLISYIVSQNIKLLIVDSVINHYRAEYFGLSHRPERQQRLVKFMHSLQVIAHTFHMAILITNQVQNDCSNTVEAKPIGGNVLAHTSTYIVQLRPSSANRTAKMIASPYHPVRDAKFTICERGIDDPEETLYRYKNPHTSQVGA